MIVRKLSTSINTSLITHQQDLCQPIPLITQREESPSVKESTDRSDYTPTKLDISLRDSIQQVSVITSGDYSPPSLPEQTQRSDAVTLAPVAAVAPYNKRSLARPTVPEALSNTDVYRLGPIIISGDECGLVPDYCNPNLRLCSGTTCADVVLLLFWFRSLAKTQP